MSKIIQSGEYFSVYGYARQIDKQISREKASHLARTAAKNSKTIMKYWSKMLRKFQAFICWFVIIPAIYFVISFLVTSQELDSHPMLGDFHND